MDMNGLKAELERVVKAVDDACESGLGAVSRAVFAQHLLDTHFDDKCEWRRSVVASPWYEPKCLQKESDRIVIVRSEQCKPGEPCPYCGREIREVE